MVMEFMIELLFTASLSVCLAFIFTRLMCVGACEEKLVTVSTKKEEEKSHGGEGVVVDENNFNSRRLETEKNISFESVDEGVIEKAEILGVEDNFVGERSNADDNADNLFEEIPEKPKVKADELVEEIPVQTQVEDGQLVEEIPLEKTQVSEIGDEGVAYNQELEIKLDDIRGSDDGKEEGLLDEDDDWEGIEKSEMDKLFDSASKFVESSENSKLLSKLSNEVQMQLYGLHKVAMEGPCREPPPMAIMVSSRAKWNAWRQLGNMTPEVAMEQYVTLLSGVIPEWMGVNSEGDNEEDNIAPEARESRKEAHESLFIHHKPDSKDERKAEEDRSPGESSDIKSL